MNTFSYGKTLSNALRTYKFDFRSDTVTKPTEKMLSAMKEASVGDDVYSEDPTVMELENRMTKITGHEAALFCATGTMTNQLALRCHLEPLTSVICDARSHVHKWECAGIAYHSQAGTTALTQPMLQNRMITLEDIKENAIESDIHTARTKVVSLENTLNGQILPLEEIKNIRAWSQQQNLICHLDGARLWNAHIKTGISLQEYCRHFDTVSLCMSKALGAPIGSVLVGSKQIIEKARHFRKLFGGGWRQAGYLAAACLYALDIHLPLLERDHYYTAYLAKELQSIGVEILNPGQKDKTSSQFDHLTNMLFISTKKLDIPMDQLAHHLWEKHCIAIFGGSGYETRLVLHHQVACQEACDAVVASIKSLSK